jgi:serine protease
MGERDDLPDRQRERTMSLMHSRDDVSRVSSTGSMALAVLAASGLMLVLGLASAAQAQVALYSNAGTADLASPGLSTGAVTFSGVAAPVGTTWSEVQAASATEANSVAGFAGSLAPMSGVAGAYRFADDFEVPAASPGGSSSGWLVTGLRTFAYVQGVASPGPGAFGSMRVRIWKGMPGAAGSMVRFGDDTTNRLVSVSNAQMYRVFSTRAIGGAPSASAPDQTRAIWRLEASLVPGVVLPPGRYFAEWQVTMSQAGAAAFWPTVTVSGARERGAAAGLGGSNAMQLRLAPPPSLVDTWLPIVDAGKPAPVADVGQELAFVLIGSVLAPACGAADIANTDGQTALSDPLIGGPDGALDNGDFSAFFVAFFSDAGDATRLAADIANTDGETSQQGGGPDGALDNGDFSAFFVAFFAGCGAG